MPVFYVQLFSYQKSPETYYLRMLLPNDRESSLVFLLESSVFGALPKCASKILILVVVLGFNLINSMFLLQLHSDRTGTKKDHDPLQLLYALLY